MPHALFFRVPGSSAWGFRNGELATDSLCEQVRDFRMSWYGFGVGVVMACIASLTVGIVESAPIGVPLVASTAYYYLVSPVPWILAGLLVIAKRLQSPQPDAEHAGTGTRAP